MTKQTIALLISSVLMLLPALASASGVGSSGGLTLITDPGSARASALGQAFTAAQDDIACLAYNPASLTSLKSGQASFLYQQGMIEDSYGHFMIGTPKTKDSAWGLSFGYYNGGKIELTDANGNNPRSVNAQTDMTAGLGYAQKFGGLSLGFTGKMLHSTLVEQVSATAYAVDFGAMTRINSRVQVGAAALNYGTQLKYEEAGDNLPRMLRTGASILLLPRSNTTLLLDVPYMVNEKIMTPSLGLETLVGPLALRTGFRSGGGVNEFTMGAGFAMGRSSLDYAFGLVNQFDAQHKVSFSMKFGGPAAPTLIVRKPTIGDSAKTRTVRNVEPAAVEKAPKVVAQVPEHRFKLGDEQTLSAPVHQRRVYQVKQGDTLASIAASELGDKRQWKSIYSANKHLIDDPTKIEEGMRIIIP